MPTANAIDNGEETGWEKAKREGQTQNVGETAQKLQQETILETWIAKNTPRLQYNTDRKPLATSPTSTCKDAHTHAKGDR